MFDAIGYESNRLRRGELPLLLMGSRLLPEVLDLGTYRERTMMPKLHATKRATQYVSEPTKCTMHASLLNTVRTRTAAPKNT